MRIQSEYSSYDFQAHQQHSQRRCCFSQTARLWFEVLPDMSPAFPGLSPALPGAPRLVAGAPSYSEGRQECPPRVWCSPEIDASKFTLHILSGTPGGFQWLTYILLMYQLPCVITTHVPQSIQVWTKHPCFARPTRTPAKELVADHLNITCIGVLHITDMYTFGIFIQVSLSLLRDNP